MTDEDVNKIGVLVDSKLDKFREGMKVEIYSALKPIDEKLGNVEKKVDTLWDQTTRLTEDMEEVKETLTSHTRALKRIEVKVEHNTKDTPDLGYQCSLTPQLHF